MLADFMMGARSRLLPATVPFRFFAAALVFHVAAWAALLAGAGDLPGYAGGPGPVLAGLHLATLGVLAMTAMGAAFQMLPVATRKPIRSERLCRLTFWLFAPGVALLTHGMGAAQGWAMAGGGALAAAGLVLFGILVADNLRQITDMKIITANAWVAVASLAAVTLLGLLLLGDFWGGILPDHGAAAATHGLLAGYGFMGMLALGFSNILIPMFTLARSLPQKPGRIAAALSGLALALAAAGLLTGLPVVAAVAVLPGLAAAALHLRAMAQAIKTGMRRNRDTAFRLFHLAWALLPAGLVVGGAAALGLWPGVTGPLWGLLLVFGWLLTFLTGVLQRIMPFLASMHSVGRSAKPALVSALTAERPLFAHFLGHAAALLLIAAGLLTGQVWPVRLGALAGLAGALSFALFGIQLWRRYRRHLADHPSVPPAQESKASC